MNQFLITSEYNSNYFVVNSGVYSITMLSTMLAEVNVDLANILLSVTTMPEIKNNLIFIPKNSELGIALNELIKEKKIVDAREIITANHLTNTLINQCLCLEDESYFQDIKRIIKDQKTGTIHELRLFYPEEVLLAINKYGRCIWHFSDDVTKKYYNNITLTGYEEVGITYHNNEWQYLDIISEEMKPIKKEDIKTKRKTKNN